MTVVSLFSQVGHIHTVGSYRLNVMYRPDIDLIVATEAPTREQATRLTKLLLDQREFQSVGFADYVSYRKPSVTKGFYWELITPYANDWWKFDIWYLAPEDDTAIAPAEHFERLLDGNPAARETILRIKEHFFDGVKYRAGITGFAIYDAVLNHGVSSLAEFIQAWDMATRAPR
jgi:hypothetical protein